MRIIAGCFMDVMVGSRRKCVKVCDIRGRGRGLCVETLDSPIFGSIMVLGQESMNEEITYNYGHNEPFSLFY